MFDFSANFHAKILKIILTNLTELDCLRNMYMNYKIHSHKMNKASTSVNPLSGQLLLFALFYKWLLGISHFTGAIYLYHHGFFATKFPFETL